MRGGDFWQGAAAGFVSSLAGSAAQGIGIHGWGMVDVSAFSGGVGAAIAGGKAEDILFGIVQGAMVGALNHLQNHAQQKIYDKQLKAIFDAYPKGDENNPNYVSRDELFKQIGGDLEKWYNENPKNPNLQNTCALRLSKALNDAGYTIPRTNATYNGADGKNYFLTVDAITTYLSNSTVFGEPTLLTRGRIKNAIIWQSNCGWNDATGHVDIIYKYRVGSHFYNQCGTVSYWH